MRTRIGRIRVQGCSTVLQKKSALIQHWFSSDSALISSSEILGFQRSSELNQRCSEIFRYWTALNQNWVMPESELISADKLWEFNPGCRLVFHGERNNSTFLEIEREAERSRIAISISGRKNLSIDKSSTSHMMHAHVSASEGKFYDSIFRLFLIWKSMERDIGTIR